MWVKVRILKIPFPLKQQCVQCHVKARNLKIPFPWKQRMTCCMSKERKIIKKKDFFKEKIQKKDIQSKIPSITLSLTGDGCNIGLKCDSFG